VRRPAGYGEQDDIDLCGNAYGWDDWPTSGSADESVPSTMLLMGVSDQRTR